MLRALGRTPACDTPLLNIKKPTGAAALLCRPVLRSYDKGGAVKGNTGVNKTECPKGTSQGCGAGVWVSGCQVKGGTQQSGQHALRLCARARVRVCVRALLACAV